MLKKEEKTMSDQEKKVFDQEVNPDEMKAAAGGGTPLPPIG